MKTYIAAGLAISLFSLGCTYDEAGLAPPPTARDRLTAGREMLDLVPAACFLEVNDRALPLEEGRIQVDADLAGTVRVIGIDIRLGDVTVPATADAPELHFTNVRISLPEAVTGPTEWSASGDAGFARVTTDVLLDMSLVAPNGYVAPLATQRIEDLTLDVDLFDALDGRLTAVVYGEREGTFWSWAGLLTLSDLVVDLRAAE